MVATSVPGATPAVPAAGNVTSAAVKSVTGWLKLTVKLMGALMAGLACPAATAIVTTDGGVVS